MQPMCIVKLSPRVFLKTSMQTAWMNSLRRNFQKRVTTSIANQMTMDDRRIPEIQLWLAQSNILTQIKTGDRKICHLFLFL